MAVTAHFYALGYQKLFTPSSIDWVNDTMTVALLDSTYTPDQDTDEFFAGVSGDEISGTGYTAGGMALAGLAIAYDSGFNKISIEADDAIWSPVTIVAHYAVVYKDTGSAATSPLLSYMDFGEDISSGVGGDFSIFWTDGQVGYTVLG